VKPPFKLLLKVSHERPVLGCAMQTLPAIGLFAPVIGAMILEAVAPHFDLHLMFVPVLGLATAGVLAGVLGRRWLEARVGSVAFYEDGIEMLDLPLVYFRVRVAWHELESFDDRAGDFVRVWTRLPRLESFTVPTPDEATRARVLEVLVDQGLSRREG